MEWFSSNMKKEEVSNFEFYAQSTISVISGWISLTRSWVPLLTITDKELSATTDNHWQGAECHYWQSLTRSWVPLLTITDKELSATIDNHWQGAECHYWQSLTRSWVPLLTITDEELSTTDNHWRGAECHYWQSMMRSWAPLMTITDKEASATIDNHWQGAKGAENRHCGEFLGWNIGERTSRQKLDTRKQWKGCSSTV